MERNFKNSGIPYSTWNDFQARYAAENRSVSGVVEGMERNFN